MTVLLLIVVAGFAWNRRSERGKRDALARVKELIPDGVQEGERISGHMEGRAVAFELGTSGSGSYVTLWTRIDVAVAELELLLNIRPQTAADVRDVRDGIAIDVILGDPAFDAAFLVEAAPDAVVRHVLDAPTRALMLRVGDWDIRAQRTRVTLRANTWVRDPAQVADAITLAVTLAARIESGFDKMAAEHEPAGGGGYRVQAAESVEDRTAREVAAAKATLARPRPWEISLTTAALLIVLVVVLGGVVYTTLTRH